MGEQVLFTYKREYPTLGVAEHEVLLSFVNDEDATCFREWLEDIGEDLFIAFRADWEDVSQTN